MLLFCFRQHPHFEQFQHFRLVFTRRNVIGLIMKFEIEKKKLKFVNLCLYALVYRITQAQTKSAVDKKN